MFKRFHRLGFNGRFISVNWHGDTGLDYHHAVYNAFQASMKLNASLASAMPESDPLTIAAHSLGNMLVSNALTNGGLKAKNYFMINAAVPKYGVKSVFSNDEMSLKEAVYPNRGEYGDASIYSFTNQPLFSEIQI